MKRPIQSRPRSNKNELNARRSNPTATDFGWGKGGKGILTNSVMSRVREGEKIISVLSVRGGGGGTRLNVPRLNVKTT